jgi:2-methylaconitate cis-trans-isomerase PrpF
VVEGELAIPGIAAIRLDFIDPGGATTGRLLPSGHAMDMLDIPGLGTIAVSMVDAANACVFVAAEALGLKGTEMPDELERNAVAMEQLAAIRLHASVAMGIGRTLDEAHARQAVPFIGFVSPAQDALTLSGEKLDAASADLTIRMLSNAQPHRALPLTASLCAAVAARIEGSIVARASRRDAGDRLRLAMPSGVLMVGAEVRREGAGWRAARGSFYRTARRLFEGCVYA